MFGLLIKVLLGCTRYNKKA